MRKVELRARASLQWSDSFEAASESAIAKTAKKAKATKTKKKPVDADEDAESDDSWISDDTDEEVE